MEKVKKYKYVGTQREADEYADPSPVVGRVYNVADKISDDSVKFWVALFPEEWEEVSELDCLSDTADSLGHELVKKKDNITPSTEEAYVEQLKKQAFVRFGEIKVGDRFYTEFDDVTFEIDEGIGFEYDLSDNVLMFNGWSIYENEVWAKKLPEKIEVDLSEAFTARNYQGKTEFKIDFKTSSVVCPVDLANSGFKNFLKKSIEDFINSGK